MTSALRRGLALAAMAILAAACTTPSGGGGGTGTTVPPVNRNPIAAFTTTPGSGSAPLQVTLDGTFSTDPDGAIASYAWDLGDGDTATGARSPTPTERAPTRSSSPSPTAPARSGP